MFEYIKSLFNVELCEGKPYNTKSDVWALGMNFSIFFSNLVLHRAERRSWGTIVLSRQ